METPNLFNYYEKEYKFKKIISIINKNNVFCDEFFNILKKYDFFYKISFELN